MREILFRAKIINSDEWVKGYLTINHFAGKEYLAIEQRERRIVTYDYEDVMQPYEIDSATVGQYTGLTDKNGTKIFEGDIISDLGGSMDGIPRVVIWNEDWMEFETYLTKRHWAYGINNSRLWCMRGREIEVIGNIHDNPELLND